MSAVLFQTFESSKHKMNEYNNPSNTHPITTSMPTLIIAGAISGVVTSFITSPTELIKILVQV